MSLIYGENGSGKTSILRLLYATLSSSGHEGLRGYLTSVPFKSFRVALTSGWSFSVERSTADAGNYRYSIHIDGKQAATALVGLNAEQKAESKEGPSVPEFLKIVREMKLDILFLGHDRELRSTVPAISATRQRLARTRRDGDSPSWPGQRPDTIKPPLKSTVVAAALMDVVQRQIIAQANVGQINSNAIYLDLAKRLAAFQNTDTLSQKDFEGILFELDSLQSSSAALRELRSLPSISFEEFKEVLKNAPVHRRDDLIRILRPFLESTRARLDALTPIAAAINLLVHEMSNYLRTELAPVV
jgi:hypothetical protein